VLDDGYADGAVQDLNGHAPAGPLKGGKYSIYEGGTRMPFIVRWPDRVKPGVSDALVCQVDLMASLAALAGQELPAEAGPDSINVLPALLGESKQGRETLVEHAAGLGFRKGPWKYIPPGGGPGRRGPGPAEQLYNLAEDLGETRNLAAEKPDLARELAGLLKKAREAGRTRP
jgi:arylsulfatase A-like enzyme